MDANRQVCLSSRGGPSSRSRPHPRHRLPALLRPGDPGGRRGPDHRRVRRGQGDLLQALPGQGRAGPRLPRQGGRHLDRPAARGGRGGRPRPADQLVGLFDALGTACRREGYRGCAFINAAAEAMPGTAVHERTVAHKQAVLAWVRDLAAQAGAADPDSLARSLACCSTAVWPTAPSPRTRRRWSSRRRQPDSSSGGRDLRGVPRSHHARVRRGRCRPRDPDAMDLRHPGSGRASPERT